jgi:hypothetical protein
MIVSLNLPEEVIAFIDGKAADAKQSRSAWMAETLHRMQLMDSPAGRKGFAHLVQGVMAEGALRAGQPMEVVRKLFPDFDGPLLLDQPAPPTPQLPAGSDAPSPPAAPEVVAVSRRRPYQRAGTRGVKAQVPSGLVGLAGSSPKAM